MPFRHIDTARSELDCFREVATFLEGVALRKVSRYRDYLVRQRRLEDAAEGWGKEPCVLLYTRSRAHDDIPIERKTGSQSV